MKTWIFTIVLNIIFFKAFLSDNVETQEELKTQQNTDNNNNDQDVVYNEDEPTRDYSFSREWEARMSDYEPSYVYMIPVKGKGTEKFFENFNKVPVKIRGAFLTEDTKNDKIEFAVVSPQNKLVYKNYTSECIFEFEAKYPGEYSLRFRNLDNSKEIKVTFTLNTAQEEVLSKEHLTYTETKIDNLNHFMNKLTAEDGLFTRQKINRQKRKYYM